MKWSDGGAAHGARRRVRRVARRAALDSLVAARARLGMGSTPDFVIAGAQRCGTTSLFRALSAHENVLPNVMGCKGAHYFDTAHSREMAWYYAHFASWSSRRRASARLGGATAVVGEASPYYLYHPLAPARMRQVVPGARLIVLLRDPVLRAHSHYQHMVWEGHESLPTFEEALDAEPARLGDTVERMRRLRDGRFPEHQHFGYFDRGLYADQIRRLWKEYPQEQVLVMATEDLFRSDGKGLARVQQFLGLPVNGSLTLDRTNAGSYGELRAETRDVLSRRYAESNEALAQMLSRDLPWT